MDAMSSGDDSDAEHISTVMLEKFMMIVNIIQA